MRLLEEINHKTYLMLSSYWHVLSVIQDPDMKLWRNQEDL